MPASHRSLVLLIGALFFLAAQKGIRQSAPLDNAWKNHPALAKPDGQSHRGGKMIAARISDPRILAELSKRFRQTEPLQLVANKGKVAVSGGEDFERRQEYLLRLLDYYWFSRPRLVGMTRAQVEEIFGPLRPEAERAYITGGRDTFYLWFKKGRVSDAFYAMGY